MFLALGSVDSKDGSSSGRSAPSSSRTPLPEPKPPTAEEQSALDDGIHVARQKVDSLLAASMMNMDIAVSDSCSIKGGQVSVTLKVRLLSEDGRRSFANGSLRRQVYPGLKGVYVSSLQNKGFSRVTVYTDTDF